MESAMKLDDEIRLLEKRITEARHRLGQTTTDLGDSARHAIASPQVLGIAVAVGFVLGKLTDRPRRSAAAARGAGLGAVLMAVILPLVRMAYASALESFWNQLLRSRRSAEPGAVRSTEDQQAPNRLRSVSVPPRL
jgi:hypothetical protein